MGSRRRAARGTVTGVLYLALGALFLLDRLDLLRLRPGYVPPFLVIGFGIALLAGGRRTARAADDDWD